MIDSLDVAVDDGRLEGVQVHQPPRGPHRDVAPLPPGERLRARLALEAVRDATVRHVLVHEAGDILRSGGLRVGETENILSTDESH